MANETTRRDMLKTSLAVAGLGLLGMPEWALPVMAQGETVVPFTDWPENFNANPAPDRRLFDTRTITSPFTAKDQFFTTQHYGHPVVDPAAYRLKVSGLVNTPASLSLDDLRKMGNAEIICGFECSGNRRPLQGLIGNGRWTGVPLKTVLEKAGLKANAREIVFFGADKGPEEVEFRAQKFAVEQNYGRSMPRDKALGDRGLRRLRAQRRAAHPASGRAAAPARAGLVRRAEREVALRDPSRRRTSTSASSRRAGTAPSRAR